MKRYMVKTFLAWMCLVLIGMSAQGVFAQDYPTRPIRLIISAGAGGAVDIFIRTIEPEMSRVLGQQVVLENRPGAGNILAAEIVAKAPADGYTVLNATQSHTVNVSLYKKLTYDIVRDFEPVTLLGSNPLIVVVHPSLPVNSIKELVALAKSKPGEINYASTGAGNQTSLGAELFKITAGVNLQEVRYKGGGNAVTAIVSGEVPVYFSPPAAVLPFIKEGKLRALAVTSDKRMPTLPEYPTVAESGYPGYEFGSWLGLAVPAKTPKKVITALREAAVSALKQPDVIKRMNDISYTIYGSQPEEFGKFIKTEIEKWKEVIEKTGMKAE